MRDSFSILLWILAFIILAPLAFILFVGLISAPNPVMGVTIVVLLLAASNK